MLQVCVAILDVVVMCVRELRNILSFGAFDPTDLHILDNTFYKIFFPHNTESHRDLVQQEGNKEMAEFLFLGELSLEVNTKHEHPLTAGTQGCSCLFLTLKLVKYAELQKQSVSLIVISNGTLFLKWQASQATLSRQHPWGSETWSNLARISHTLLGNHLVHIRVQWHGVWQYFPLSLQASLSISTTISIPLKCYICSISVVLGLRLNINPI